MVHTPYQVTSGGAPLANFTKADHAQLFAAAYSHAHATIACASRIGRGRRTVIGQYVHGEPEAAFSALPGATALFGDKSTRATWRFDPVAHQMIPVTRQIGGMA